VWLEKRVHQKDPRSGPSDQIKRARFKQNNKENKKGWGACEVSWGAREVTGSHSRIATWPGERKVKKN
jgi:hypothetical protein